MKKILFYSLLAFVLFSCEKVNDLGDNVFLEGFKVVSASPFGIELAEPELIGDTVFLTVLRGVSLFPMTLHGEPIISGETDQAVPGGTFESFSNIKLDLEDVHDTKFYLIAKSGLPKEYYIKLITQDQSKRNDIHKAALTNIPQTALIGSNAYVNPIKNTITIHTIENSFPLSLTSAITVADKTILRDEQSQKLDNENLPLTFTSINDVIAIKSEAEDGRIQDWTIQLKKATPVTADHSIDIQNAVKPAKGEHSIVSQTQDFTVAGTLINDTLKTIRLDITPGETFQELRVKSDLKVLSNSQILGYNTSDNLVFADYNSAVKFYILDIKSGIYSEWKYTLRQIGTTDVLKFPFTYYNKSPDSNYIRIDSLATINNNDGVITLTLTKTSAANKYWPLSVEPKNLILSPGATTDVSKLTFRNVNDQQTFMVKSAAGLEKVWKVKLKYNGTLKSGANIDSIRLIESSLSSLTTDRTIINSILQSIFIDVPDINAFPLRISPNIYISAGASFADFQNGDFLEFNSFEDVIPIDVIAENGSVKQWKIKLYNTVQLLNSDFELWAPSITNFNAKSIDLIPGIGRGWATANNMYIRGTDSVRHAGNGYAAEMTTGLITKMPENLITAGTLFLGHFSMSPITLETPKKMTKFGIPYTARPIAIEIEAKYKLADTYQISKHVSGSGTGSKYVVETIPGQDRGHIWIELVHWAGEGALDYDGEPQNNVHVLARGEHIFTGTSDWNNIRVDFVKKANYDTYAPTHLVVVMTSSIDGHLFKGGIGSKLTVDNFKLIY